MSLCRYTCRVLKPLASFTLSTFWEPYPISRTNWCWFEWLNIIISDASLSNEIIFVVYDVDDYMNYRIGRVSRWGVEGCGRGWAPSANWTHYLAEWPRPSERIATRLKSAGNCMYIKTQRKRRHGGPLRKTQTLPPVNTLGSNVGVTHTYFFSEINRATHITFIQNI